MENDKRRIVGAKLSIDIETFSKTSGMQTVFFFDLDHYIGKKTVKEETFVSEKTTEKEPVQETQNGKAYFYSADDENDAEPQEIEEIEVLEQKLKQARELEKRTFGEPAFDYDLDFRLPPQDQNGQWDLMEKTVRLSNDYGVQKEVIEDMQAEMIMKAEMEGNV